MSKTSWWTGAAAMSAALAFAFQVAPISPPRVIQLLIWLGVFGVFYATFLSCTDAGRRWRSSVKAMRPMTIVFVGVMGAIIGGAIAVSFWLMLPIEGSAENQVAAGEPSREESAEDVLPLSLRAAGHSFDTGVLELKNVTLTNRSARRMSLNFIFHTRMTRQDGSQFWERFDGYWNATRGESFSGDAIVNVDSDFTLTGSLTANIFVVPGIKLAEGGMKAMTENCILEIRDSVSMKRVGCSIIFGYPPAEPIPPNIIGHPSEIEWNRKQSAKPAGE